MSAYLRPTSPIAADVLLPADPGLAMALATRLTTKPLMANHHHGLWGYSGRTETGAELTVQASGIGAPSAAAVLRELHGHGVRRVIRIGRCTPLERALHPGGTLVATGAVGADGTSIALGAAEPLPDPDLTGMLRDAAAGAVRGAVASHDLGEEATPADRRAWIAAGALAVDLETAAVLALGRRLGLAVAAGLVAEGDDDAVEASLLALGDAAAAALTLTSRRRGARAGAARLGVLATGLRGDLVGELVDAVLERLEPPG